MKNARHELILELIRKREVETQEELCELLAQNGLPVTQATVSRDIRQLELRKLPGKDGRSFYAPPAADGRELREKYIRILSDAFVSAEAAGNLLVVHTVAGMAMPVAAVLDSLDWKENLGSIAGDDTVFVALRNAADGPEIAGRLRKLASRRG